MLHAFAVCVIFLLVSFMATQYVVIFAVNVTVVFDILYTTDLIQSDSNYIQAFVTFPDTEVWPM